MIKKVRFCILLILLVLFGVISTRVSAKETERTIDHNKPLQVGEFMEPVEGYTFKVSEDAETYEYDEFILKVEPGIYVSDNFLDDLNYIIALIEDTTGLKFNPKKSPITSYGFTIDKYVISIKKRKMTTYGLTIENASFDTATFMEDEAANGELSDYYNTLAHELLHVIQLRNYGFLGDIITEGFAESYAGTIEEKLRDKYGYKILSDERNDEIGSIKAYGKNECGLDVDYNLDWLNADNVEKYFFLEPGHSGHEPSYWIVEYIREKYGEKGFKKLLKALAKKSTERAKSHPYVMDLPNKEELVVIEDTLSKDFVQEFYEWFTSQTMQNSGLVVDYTGTDRVEMGYITMIAYDEKPWMDFPGDFKYKDSIEFDYSRMLAHTQQVLGKDVKGISCWFKGKGLVNFYDQYGTLLYSVDSPNDENSFSAKVPYATKIVVTAAGEHDFSICSNGDSDYCDDAVFDNITCTDGRVFTIIEKEKVKPASGPVNKKVKNKKELKKALESAITRGGKITVTKNITLDEVITIPHNTELVIKKGKKITVKDCIDVCGTLSGDANSIVFKDGWLWLNENAKWKLGDVTFTTEVTKEFATHSGYGCAFRFDGGYSATNLCILYGFYNRLYIEAPKGTKLEKLIAFRELREGSKIYVNGKKLKSKEIKKYSID